MKKRYSDQDIDRLLRLAWWNWPVDVIREHVRTIWTGTPIEVNRVGLGSGRGVQPAVGCCQPGRHPHHLLACIRYYLPKGSDLTAWTQNQLDDIALKLNTRPRRILDYATPAEALNNYLGATTT